MKKKTIILAAVAALAVLGIVAAVIVFGGNGGELSPSGVVRAGTLERIAEADGVIESAHKSEVYAPSGLKVLELYVKEGDSVNDGELLAQLDTEALELEIRSAELGIKSAQVNLSNEQTAQANAITGARNAAESAAVALSAAQREYDTLLSQKGKEAAVVAAQINMDAARRAWEHSKQLFDIGDVSSEELTLAQNQYDKAAAAYDDAVRYAADALDRAGESLKTARLRSESANDALDEALDSNTDPAAVALELQMVALEEKKMRLRDARITAPAEGRVTLVNAKQGAPASGLMFVVEDDRELIVRARVEETDMSGVAAGTRCRVRPAGKELELEGVVTSLPASAERDPTGELTAVIGDDVYFMVEISVNGAPEDVLIGMNAKVSFIVESLDNVFAAPAGLVFKDGESRRILTARDGRLVEIPVETGMETGSETQIISDGLSDGMELYREP